jgi:hypothetical protein
MFFGKLTLLIFPINNILYSGNLFAKSIYIFSLFSVLDQSVADATKVVNSDLNLLGLKYEVSALFKIMELSFNFFPYKS